MTVAETLRGMAARYRRFADWNRRRGQDANARLDDDAAAMFDAEAAKLEARWREEDEADLMREIGE